MAGLIQRGDTYYAVYRVGNHEKRVSLKTDSLQVAKEKLRKLESRLARGGDNPLPSKTPIREVVDAYVKHIRAHKTPKSPQPVAAVGQMLQKCDGCNVGQASNQR